MVSVPAKRKLLPNVAICSSLMVSLVPSSFSMVVSSISCRRSFIYQYAEVSGGTRVAVREHIRMISSGEESQNQSPSVRIPKYIIIPVGIQSAGCN